MDLFSQFFFKITLKSTGKHKWFLQVWTTVHSFKNHLCFPDRLNRVKRLQLVVKKKKKKKVLIIVLNYILVNIVSNSVRCLFRWWWCHPTWRKTKHCMHVLLLWAMYWSCPREEMVYNADRSHCHGLLATNSQDLNLWFLDRWAVPFCCTTFLKGCARTKKKNHQGKQDTYIII